MEQTSSMDWHGPKMPPIWHPLCGKVVVFQRVGTLLPEALSMEREFPLHVMQDEQARSGIQRT